nr:hypothetical protein [Tanacetum cinerariifolium]
MVDEANVTEKGIGEKDVMNKISQKRRVVEHNKKCNKSVFGEETSGADISGDEGVVKKSTRKQVHKRNDKKGVGCKRKNIIKMGFRHVLDIKIKDVPTHLIYWLLDNFSEETCVLNVNGKAIPITREAIKDILRAPMGSVYVQACFNTPETLRGVRVVADVSRNANNIMAETSALTPYNIYDTDILFKTDSFNGPRGVLETLCPGIKISSGVIDIFTKILNHVELYREPLKQ